jgi:hypothetical protein
MKLLSMQLARKDGFSDQESLSQTIPGRGETLRMNKNRTFPLGSFFLIVGCAALSIAAIDLLLYHAFSTLSGRASALIGADAAAVKAFSDWVARMEAQFLRYVVPASLMLLLLFSLFVWLSLPRKRPGAESVPAPKDRKESKAEIRENETRLYLHLVSVLQREGRLIDFLSENLEAYDDAQIGAAVRSIHESCRKVVQKYLSPQAVISESEGDSLTVEEGFDPATVKLTGNVTGSPPFRGIVRHRGWLAARVELPTLSGGGDTSLLAPAEVEVL